MAEATHADSFASYFDRTRRLPLFVILGVQGSGTNLLRNILAAAFGFAIVKDQAIVFNAASELGPDPEPAMVVRQFERILTHLQPSVLARKTRRLIKSNANYEGIRDCFDPAVVRSAADLARFVYSYAAFSLRTDLAALKSDDLWERIDQIDRVIPNRRIILLTRDFRDTLLSVTRKDFGPVEPLVAAHYVKERFARYESEYLRTPCARRYHLRYEDLLAAPLVCVDGLARHFGLVTQPRGREAVEQLPIRRGNTGKWSGLAPGTLSACEGILRDELGTYGYAPGVTASGPGARTLAFARVRDAVRRVPQKVMKVSRRLAS